MRRRRAGTATRTWPPTGTSTRLRPLNTGPPCSTAMTMLSTAAVLPTWCSTSSTRTPAPTPSPTWRPSTPRMRASPWRPSRTRRAISSSPMPTASSWRSRTPLPTAPGTFNLDFTGPNPAAYFPSTYSYVLAPTSTKAPASAGVDQSLAEFLCYSVGAGQNDAAPLLYAPLSREVVTISVHAIDAMPGAPPASQCGVGGPAPAVTPGKVVGNNGTSGSTGGGSGAGRTSGSGTGSGGSGSSGASGSACGWRSRGGWSGLGRRGRRDELVDGKVGRPRPRPCRPVSAEQAHRASSTAGTAQAAGRRIDRHDEQRAALRPSGGGGPGSDQLRDVLVFAHRGGRLCPRSRPGLQEESEPTLTVRVSQPSGSRERAAGPPGFGSGRRPCSGCCRLTWPRAGPRPRPCLRSACLAREGGTWPPRPLLGTTPCTPPPGPIRSIPTMYWRGTSTPRTTFSAATPII